MRKVLTLLILVVTHLSATSGNAADFLVVNLNDAGPGSLRQAILNANTNRGPDEIKFAGGLTGTITLTSGEMSIEDDLAINGPGAEKLAVSGGDASRVMVFPAKRGGDSVDIVGLTFTNGFAGGGGTPGMPGFAGAGGVMIMERGTVLTLADCVFDGNTALGIGLSLGGALFTNGDVVILDTVFKNNNATGGFIAAQGGAIWNEGNLTIVHSKFENNTVTTSDGGEGLGGAIAFLVGFGNGSASVSVDDSSFLDNIAVGGPITSGGALLAFFGPALTVSNSEFKGNMALGDTSSGSSSTGGAIGIHFGATATIDDSVFKDNLASADEAFGGAISNGVWGGGSSLEITDSNVEENRVIGVSVFVGGGIQNSADACVEDTKVVDNLANGVEDNISGVFSDNCPLRGRRQR